MEQKQICCCGAGGWTKVIGWFQVIGAGLGIVVLGFAIAASAVSLAKIDDIAKGKTPEERDKILVVLRVLLFTTVFGMVLVVLGFIMAILLLKGSYNRNPRMLQAWIVYTLVFLILSIINSVVQIIFSASGSSAWSSIVGLVVTLLVDGFCLWVVNTHKREIEASVITPSFNYKA